MIPFPNKKYQIIYADPPWRYDFSASHNRNIGNQYDTMTIEELKNLNIPVDDNSVCFMWATAPKLKECIEVLEAWGFVYRTCLVWDKEKIGMGYWFRNQHELLLVGLRGKFSPPKPNLRISSLWREKRNKHSEKPHKIREWIKNCFPDATRIELFARHKAEGWDSWGNEKLEDAYIQDKLIAEGIE